MLAADEIRYYFDENMPVAIATELKKRGIDAVTVSDLREFGDDDRNHLRRATEQRPVLCTFDSDYLKIAGEGSPHAGIIFGQQEEDVHNIGKWVLRLSEFHEYLNSDDMTDHVEYL